MPITITPETPRRNIQVGGAILSGPLPFAAGYVLGDNEAAALNQTYLENIGNNYRSAVVKAKKLAILGKTEATPEELKSVTDEKLKALDDRLEEDQSLLNIEALQAGLDAMTLTYQMGVRRSSSVEVVDPVTKAARAIAKAKLTDALKKKNIKLNTVSKDWWDREVGKLLDKTTPVIRGDKNVTEDIWSTAQRQVDLAKQAAAEGLDELDLDGVSKPKEEPANEAQNAGQDTEAQATKSSKPKKGL